MTPSPYDSDDWTRVSSSDSSIRAVAAALRARRRAIAAVVGTVSLATAVVLGAGLGGESVVTAVSSAVRASRRLLSVTAVLAGVVALWALARTVDTTDTDGFRLPPPPETSVDESTIVGAAFDESLDHRTNSTTDWWRNGGVREDVQSLALTVLQTEVGDDLDEAVRALESGRWTENPRAATYLGTDSHRPAGMRVRDWIRGDSERRQVEATLRELAVIADAAEDSATFERRESSPRASDRRESADEEVSW